MDINMNKEKVVLVVDDVFENLLILKKMLEKCGYMPVTAPSAKDALDMIKIRMPEIILLDVYMPEMDGFELCEILKSDVKISALGQMFYCLYPSFMYSFIQYTLAITSWRAALPRI